MPGDGRPMPTAIATRRFLIQAQQARPRATSRDAGTSECSTWRRLTSGPLVSGARSSARLVRGRTRPRPRGEARRHRRASAVASVDLVGLRRAAILPERGERSRRCDSALLRTPCAAQDLGKTECQGMQEFQRGADLRAATLFCSAAQLVMKRRNAPASGYPRPAPRNVSDGASARTPPSRAALTYGTAAAARARCTTPIAHLWRGTSAKQVGGELSPPTAGARKPRGTHPAMS